MGWLRFMYGRVGFLPGESFSRGFLGLLRLCFFVWNRGEFGGCCVNEIFLFWCWGGVEFVEAVFGG